jgi:hypothetical protein
MSTIPEELKQLGMIEQSKLTKILDVIESFSTDKILQCRIMDKDGATEPIEYTVEIDNGFMEVEHLAGIYQELEKLKVHLITVEAGEGTTILHTVFGYDIDYRGVI